MSARRSRSAGQALAEFALVVPVIILLFVALFDFGRAVFAFNTLSNASRDGARVAIVDQRVIAGVSLAAQEAANQATGLGLDPTKVEDVEVTYLTPDLSAPCPPSQSEWLGCVAQVRTQYRFSAATPIIGSLVGPILLSSTTQLPIERTQR